MLTYVMGGLGILMLLGMLAESSPTTKFFLCMFAFWGLLAFFK